MIENIITLIIGVILCLYGNKLRNIMTTLIWFIIGYTLSNDLLSSLISSEIILLIVRIIIGLLLSGIGIKLEKISIFIAVTFITYEVLSTYTIVDNNVLDVIIKLGIGLLMGSLSIFMIKFIFSLLTSIYGAFLIKSSLPFLVPLTSSIITPLVIVIAIMSVIIQLKISE